MMTGILEHGWELLQHNSFMQGGFVLAMVASVIAYIKGIPGRIKNMILSRIFLTISIEEGNQLYSWFEDWLDAQSDIEKKTQLVASSSWSWMLKKYKIIYTIGEGAHRLRIGDFRAYVSRGKEGNGKNGGVDSAAGSPKSEGSFFAKKIYTIKTWRWNRPKVKAFLDNVQTMFRDNTQVEPRVGVYYWRMDQWNCGQARIKRKLDSIVLKSGQMETILARFKKFFDEETWYLERGIPYQFGASFVGPPGTGKSSLILSLAGHFKYDIYVLHLKDMTDAELTRAFASVSERAIFVVEDIDVYFEGREVRNPTRVGGVSFDGFINAVNGLMDVHGRILCITSNKEETLDAALVRKGRIDLRVVLDQTDSFQRRRMFETFYPDHKHLAQQFADICDDLATEQKRDLSYTPAEIQDMFLEYPHSPEALVDALTQRKAG